MHSGVEFKFFNAEGQCYYINTITDTRQKMETSVKNRTRTITPPSLVMRITKIKGFINNKTQRE